RRIAEEYYRLLTRYDVEFASLWLDGKLNCPEDIHLFKIIQQEIAGKYGL
ncbi:MAG: hypothetical protein GTN53_27955, partial [Candidatus Aminicenantes bacterium]|nr:hypothetical protein [Candidatus Aminicenantes bacterium]NIT26349.1 hypothetical protein [Candidatus Aminicenantes bacterium]